MSQLRVVLLQRQTCSRPLLSEDYEEEEEMSDEDEDRYENEDEYMFDSYDDDIDLGEVEDDSDMEYDSISIWQAMEKVREKK